MSTATSNASATREQRVMYRWFIATMVGAIAAAVLAAFDQLTAAAFAGVLAGTAYAYQMRATRRARESAGQAGDG